MYFSKLSLWRCVLARMADKGQLRSSITTLFRRSYDTICKYVTCTRELTCDKHLLVEPRCSAVISLTCIAARCLIIASVHCSPPRVSAKSNLCDFCWHIFNPAFGCWRSIDFCLFCSNARKLMHGIWHNR